MTEKVSRRSRIIGTYCVLALIVYIGLSYRLYLARYHTEVGIEGMAGWWGYIINNANAIRAGNSLQSGTLYAPGQSIFAYLIFSIFPSTPATLRVCFGFLDAIAIVFVFLAAKEMLNWTSGFIAALFYSLWPEGASASVNILHDHSPQPLFLFAGLWCVLLWLRLQRWFLLIVGGIFLGMPGFFRTDGVVITLAVPLAIFFIMVGTRHVWRSTAYAIVLFLATLIPSLPYDLYLLHKTGMFVHIGAGDVWSAVFIRYGRTSGMGGSRYADNEVAFVSGVNQPFGHAWDDVRRLDNPSRFGKVLFFTDPLKYLKVVAQDSWPHVATTRHQFWLPPGQAKISDVGLAGRLHNPEWPMAVLVSYSRIQSLLSSRIAILTLAASGLLFGLIVSWRPVVIVTAAALSWAGALLMLLPNARYLLMPLCPVLLLGGVCLGCAPYLIKYGIKYSLIMSTKLKWQRRKTWLHGEQD